MRETADSQSKADSPPDRLDVSLIRGGPFYRLQQWSRLMGANDWNVGRRITFAIAVGWVPLVLMKLLFNRSGLLVLLKDYRITSRMLIAVPVLLLAQPIMESSFRKIVRHIYDAGLLKSPELAQIDDIIAKVIQLRDSVVPELVIVLLIVIHTALSFKSVLSDASWLAYRVGDSYHLTLTGWYAVLVSGTIFQFLLGLNLWKWLLWTIFAFKVSRLNLQLIATHPDENGGLGFLGMTPLAFTPISFATAAVIAATFRNQILHKGAHLASFAIPAIVLVALVAVVALGPLVFFVPRLAAVRRKGILEYAVLGQMQSTEFHEKWILNRAGREEELLDAAEISTLCDFGQAYDRIEEMTPFPTDRSALVGLALSVAIPALPVVVAEIPLIVILKQLLGALK
jgi:hypothetical protein